MRTLPKRSDLPKEQTWNLEAFFASEAEWRAALLEAARAVAEVRPFAGRLAESAATLRTALQTYETRMLQAMKVFQYASLQLATDGTNPAFTRMVGEARAVVTQLAAAGAYLEPELLRIPAETLEAFMQAEPALRVYRHYLEALKTRQLHILSEEVEAVLASAADPLSAHAATAYAATNADMQFRPVEHQGEPLAVSHSTIGELLVHESPEVRKAAWASYADGHLAFKNTLAATLQGSIKSFAFQARTRGYPSSLEMALAVSRTCGDNIPRAVYDNLLAIFQAHLPTWHRFWRIRKKALGGRLHSYDVPIYDAPAPLVPSPKISFWEAAETICRGMEPLGPEYVEPMRRGLFEERWVDWGQNQGKRAGAFSSGLKGTFPYILMSWSDDLFSLSTLAHELGHSMHSYFTRQTQPIIYARYSLFVAEVASNFNQALVRARLLREAQTPEQKLAVLEEAFANFHRYLFVMPTLARFELELYTRIEQGGALTAPYLMERLAELFAEGYGGQVELDRERLGAGWMHFSHLYSPFYVYQYATGIAAANALAQDVLEQGEPAARRYLDFLKAGDSVYPLEALKIAGIDMHSPEPVERGFGVLKSMVDELEKLVG
ncbi:MAG: oligoendopeptidase F [Meiothermus sp.]|uniref:oligoendopeptidase F n=1 Tax=Meiothermus sp. TaxID=1955249 RepID=UPI0025EB1AE5|nr:oligoendopeptidase F [Meiothermus sp.]MCS7068142.1 oligoendopeptidase F [Meiothermus sp.]MDW8424572.1 oligoendopeptidase F [Meiothermus sp.]